MGALTYFGSASSPADNGAAAGPGPTAITPPASMTLNDLVLVYLQYRGTGVALSFNVSETGGQDWAELYNDLNGTNISVALWACRFNGTWSANPSFVADSTLAFTQVMDVYRPTGTGKIVDIDISAVNGSFAAGTTPFTKTITGITTRHADAMVIAYWATADDNTWDTLTSGWINPGGVTQIRNTTGSDQSMTRAYQSFASAGATGNVAMNQATLGGDAGRTCIISFYERDDPAAGVPPVDLLETFEDSTDGTTITTTILNNGDNLSGAIGSWQMINSGGTTNLTIELDADKDFGGTKKFSVSATEYDGVGTRGMAQDHSTQGGFSHGIQFDLTTAQNAVSTGFFFRTSIAYASANFSITLDQVVDGGFAGLCALNLLHERSDFHTAQIENVLSETKRYARLLINTWYWVTQYYNDADNVGLVAIYDPTTWKQVGFTGQLRLGSTPGNFASFELGQNGGGLANQTGITLFDNMVLDLNAAFPLLPGESGATLVTSSDALRAGLSEDRAVLVAVSTPDGLKAGLVETTTGFNTAQGAELVPIGLSDSSLVTNMFGSSDSLAVTLSELATIAVNIVSADAAAVIVSEASAMLANLSSSDTVLIALSEDRAIFVTVSTPDALIAGLSESGSLLCMIRTEDAPSVVIVEGHSLQIFEDGGLVAVASADALMVGLLENATPIFTILSTRDDLALTWQESASIFALLSSADALTVPLVETATIAVNVTSGSEALTIGLADASQPPFVTVAGADAVAAIIAEANSIFVRLASADDILLGVQDALNRIFATLSASDAPAVVLVESAIPMVPIQSADAVLIGLTENGTAVEVFLNRLGSVLVATVRRVSGVQDLAMLLRSRTVARLGGERTVEVL